MNTMKAVLLVKDYDKKTNTLGEIGCREVEKPKIVHGLYSPGSENAF